MPQFKPLTIRWTILWLILMLMGLSACRNDPADSRSSRNSTPIPLPVETGGSTPFLTPGEQDADPVECTFTDPHPIGASIAQTYAVSYEQVMAWFCQGYSFENILIALETSQAVDLPAETLLEMLLENEWEDIWEQVGLVDAP